MSHDINNLQRHELIDTIIKWIGDENMSKGEIINRLLENVPSFTRPQALEMIDEAIDKLYEEIDINDPVKIMNKHIAIYQEICAYFEKTGSKSGMNKAQRAKEKLLKILKGKNKVVVSEKKATVTTIANEQYDINKLSPEKQKRLNELLNKCK
jgi:hypothetical protein